MNFDEHRKHALKFEPEKVRSDQAERSINALESIGRALWTIVIALVLVAVAIGKL